MTDKAKLDGGLQRRIGNLIGHKAFGFPMDADDVTCNAIAASVIAIREIKEGQELLEKAKSGEPNEAKWEVLHDLLLWLIGTCDKGFHYGHDGQRFLCLNCMGVFIGAISCERMPGENTNCAILDNGLASGESR